MNTKSAPPLYFKKEILVKKGRGPRTGNKEKYTKTDLANLKFMHRENAGK